MKISCVQMDMSEFSNYEEARWQHYVDVIPCRIYLLSEDPDGLRGINQEKMAKAQQKWYPIVKKYRDQIENKYQWCIAAVPGEAWAKKLFPALRASQAVEKLWQAILETSRVTDDPIAAWQAHNEELAARCRYLNALGIRSLHYQSANGTDLTVGMYSSRTAVCTFSISQVLHFHRLGVLEDLARLKIAVAGHDVRVADADGGRIFAVAQGAALRPLFAAVAEVAVVRHGGR